jgi:hypothetical protein
MEQRSSREFLEISDTIFLPHPDSEKEESKKADTKSANDRWQYGKQMELIK